MESRLNEILSEVNEYAARIRPEDLDALAQACLKARRIFTAGAGRSGLAARAFANRLLHLDRPVHAVGEITCPPVAAGDLLVVCSGSGETAALKAAAERAKAEGADVALLTMVPDSSIGRAAGLVIPIPGSSPKAASDTASSIQPMGTLFEQLSALAFDAVILEMMEQAGETNESMFSRHANLE